MIVDVDYVVDMVMDLVEVVGIVVCFIVSEFVVVSFFEKNVEYIFNGGIGIFDLYSIFCICVGRCL